MTRVALQGGAYEAKSLIASAQRCVNLYGEQNPPDAPFPYTYYPTPGLRVLASPVTGKARLDYVASNGSLFRVVGQAVYVVASDWTHTSIGSIDAGASMCSMSDNGQVAVLVDGSAKGYAIDLTSNAFAQIANPLFFGADRVDYMDTFFTFNRPGTPIYYISLSQPGYIDLTTPTVIAGFISSAGTAYTNGTYTNVPFSGGSGSGAVASSVTVAGGIVTAISLPTPYPGQDYAATDVLSIDKSHVGGTGSGFAYTLTTAGAFNSLDVAEPTGMAGNIVTHAVAHRNDWIFKANATEVWYDTGAADFAFGPSPGTLIEHGCAAKYSVCTYDSNVFWLGKNKAGQGIVLRGAPYEAKRISNHALEAELMGYADISDAIGFVYQQGGHAFYVLSFPTGDATWVYDMATDQWHERSWIDTDGTEHRARVQTGCFAYGQVVVSDWETGALYAYDPGIYTDNGSPIVRIRGFPHILEDGDRVMYRQFIAELDAGNVLDLTVSNEPLVSLRWSDSRGHSWGSPVTNGMGSTGQYNRSVQWQRLGMARDRVFEISWSAPVPTALSGAFIDFSKAGT